jgi:hypothetical protein
VSAADAARRLVEDVQRLGLHSASSVVERYALAVEQAVGLDPGAGVRPPTDPDALVDATARMARAYLGLLDGLAGLADRPGRPRRDLETVPLPATRPGASARVSLWVHNGTAGPVDAVVRIGPLVSAEGGVLPTEAAGLEPTSVAVPAAGRAEMRLRVDVPGDQPTGTYFGVALSPVAGSVVLRLDVVEGAGP